MEYTKNLHGFISEPQRRVLEQCCKGEEGQWFIEKIAEYAKRIAKMPKTYEQDGKGDQAIIYLHYFLSGCDWWITEKDVGGDQQQAFGLADLGCPEMGYISIIELIANNAELDLHFRPCPLGDIKASL